MADYCTLKPYFPGIPTSEPLLKQAWKLSGLLERDSVVYLGKTEYGLLVEELRGVGAPANEWPLNGLKFGIKPCLHAVSAGTDDKAHVARLNRDTPGAQEFQLKAAKLQSGRAPA